MNGWASSPRGAAEPALNGSTTADAVNKAATGHAATAASPPPTISAATAAPAAAPLASAAEAGPPVTKIYIGGLPETTREEDLHDCFSQLGRVKQIELKRGYGFVVSSPVPRAPGPTSGRLTRAGDAARCHPSAACPAALEENRSSD